LVRMWVEAHGESAHTGSQSWQDGTKGANAIEALTRFIGALSGIQLEETHSAFPGYAFKHTPTLIEGGSGESIVPDTARVLVDARLLPNHNNEAYIGQMTALAKKFERKKMRFDTTIKTNIPGVVIAPDERIVQILKQLDEEVMGIRPALRGSGPASEGYMFIKSGIPTICGFGAEGDGAHADDEYLKLDSLPKVLEMYVRAAIELTG
ncbi:M20/M25/M40 family metallo-hydrolase, partial [Candidatus Roizmanbacteria bacterium]|nr:M20/M25/M40 family metallo-hydrolase [Candidatus Roizmanbacteria bacterium]